MAGEQDPVETERVIAPLAADQEAAAARLLTACAPDGAEESAAGLLADLRATEGADLVGLTVAGELVGLSVTRRTGMTMELTLLLVAPGARRQGHGKELLIEALVRAGRRPTVTEAGEADLPFYRAMRFKPVARRRQPDGSVRYRLGWHPPGQRTHAGAAREAARS